MPVINFVKNAPAQIVDILSRAREERDWLTLADFFPAPPEDEGVPEHDSGGAGGTEPDLPPRTLPPSPPEPYRIERTTDGFCVLRADRDVTPLPAALDIRVAYDTTRGNPLARYHPADFDLAHPPIEITLKGAEIVRAAGNQLQVRPTAEDFRIEVAGFDQNRDLYVRINLTEGEETDSSATPGVTGAMR